MFRVSVLSKVLRGMAGKCFSLGFPWNLGSSMAGHLAPIVFSLICPQGQVKQGSKTSVPRMRARPGGDQFCQSHRRDQFCVCVFVGMGWHHSWGLAFHKHPLGKDLGNFSGRPNFNPIGLYVIGQGHGSTAHYSLIGTSCCLWRLVISSLQGSAPPPPSL